MISHTSTRARKYDGWWSLRRTLKKLCIPSHSDPELERRGETSLCNEEVEGFSILLEPRASLRLARTHVRSPWSFIPSLHLELDAHPLLQNVEVKTLKAAAMEEYFLALSGADKPKTTITDNSLDGSLHGHLGQRKAGFAPGKKDKLTCA
jgi:hypothetical protein